MPNESNMAIIPNTAENDSERIQQSPLSAPVSATQPTQVSSPNGRQVMIALRLSTWEKRCREVPESSFFFDCGHFLLQSHLQAGDQRSR